MLSCFLEICRIFLCYGEEENQERRSSSSSSYGGYYSLPPPPPQRESNSPRRSPAPEAYTYISSRKAPSPYSFPSAASTCFLSSSLAAPPKFSKASPPLSKPSSSSLVSSNPSSSSSSSSYSSSLTPPLIASFSSPSPAKPQSPHTASAGAKTSPLSKPSSSSSPVSSHAASSSSSSSSSLTPSLTASFASLSPAKRQSPCAASAGAKASRLSEPRSSPSLVSSKSSSSSSSSSSLAASATATLASPHCDQRNKIGQLPRYEIPKHLQEQIKNDFVPKVLRKPLSPSTYAEYFAALLYAEDYYCEKWSNFLLCDVTLKLREKDSFETRNSAGTKKNSKSSAQKGRPFVAFEIDSVPERRPYLLSRDHVLLRPAGKKIEPFQGILFRVEKSKWVIAEFSDDFHNQHSPSKKYDVSFSFNRVCLKRSHHAVSAAMDPFLCSILFPDAPCEPFLGPIRNSDFGDFTQNDRNTIICRILRLRSPQPYLLEGPPLETPSGDLSGMGNVIRLAILQLCRTCSSNRILVCAPRNRTLDGLTESLLKDIPESRIFRANAAFRPLELVPGDIMPTCLFEGECFACPPLADLESFRVVTSTFISSYRLYAAGIGARHFTHIFLVDASYATEPETIVAFANLVGNSTAIVVTGSARESPAWVRSDIGRRNGLKKSFFQRLLETEPYSLHDPTCIARIKQVS